MRANNKKAPAPALTKGQLWQTEKAYLHIVELGKTLIHYRMTKSLKQRGVVTHTSAIDTFAEYLKVNGGRLIKARPA